MLGVVGNRHRRCGDRGWVCPQWRNNGSVIRAPGLERGERPATRTFDNQGRLRVARTSLRDTGRRGPDRPAPVLPRRRAGWHSRKLCRGTSPKGRTLDDLNWLRDRTNWWGNGLRSLVAGLRPP